MSWNTHKLGELIETKKGYAFKSSWYQNYGHPIVKVSDFTDDSIDTSSLANIPQEIADEYSSYKLCERDVIIQTVGSWPSNPASVVGKCINVPLAAHGALLNQNAVKISPKDRLDNIFLYYLLRSPAFKNYIINTARGSASQASITLDAIRKFEITIPSAESQKHIGFVLKCYDDLIENNRRRIQLLEESARLLYKEWFVQLRFPGHEHVKIVDGVPEGWAHLTVGTLLGKIKRKGKVKKDDYKADGVLACVDQSKEFIGGYIDSTELAIVDELPILVFGDHTRVVKYIDFPFAPGADGTQLLIPKSNEIPRVFFYFLIAGINLANAFYARHFKFLKATEVLVPKKELMRLFEDSVSTNMNQISLLREQNKKLSKARDILLPRLMNGTLTV